MEYAEALTATRDPAALDKALSLLDARLAKGDDPAIRLKRARARVWAGRVEQGIADYRVCVASAEAGAPLRLEFAEALSSQKSLEAQREAAALFSAHLASRPDDDGVLLKRARVRGWGADVPAAVSDYRAYLAKHPDDGAVRLELAQALSAQKAPERLREALAIYDQHLGKSGGDLAVRLRRGRVRSWLGDHGPAVDDFRAYLAKHDEAPVRVELAGALAEGKRLDEAAAEYARAAAMGADSPDLQLRRARVLLWQGDHAPAETLLAKLRSAEQSPAMKTPVELELSRLYAQTERPLDALRVLDGVVAREPDNTTAKEERARLAQEYRTAIIPGFFAYSDRNDILLFQTSLDAPIYASPWLNGTAHASVWRLSDGVSTNWTQRFDLGVQGRPSNNVELSATFGPRVSPAGTDIAGSVGIRARPSGRFQMSLRYAYDDIYQDLFQPNSIGVRGSNLQGEIAAKFPRDIALQMRVGARWVEPTNNDFEASWTLTAPVGGRVFRVGYFGQWLGWTTNSIKYWSPQAYTAHMLLVRASHEFRDERLSVDGQVSMGTAAERVKGLPNAGFGFAFGVGGALVYRPLDWMVLRGGVQFGSTLREQVVERPGATPDAPVVRASQGNTYWWMTPYVSLTLIP